MILTPDNNNNLLRTIVEFTYAEYGSALEMLIAAKKVNSPRLNSFLYWLSIKRLILEVFTMEKVKSALFPSVRKIGCFTPVPSKSELRKFGARSPDARVIPGSGVCRYGV